MPSVRAPGARLLLPVLVVLLAVATLILVELRAVHSHAGASPTPQATVSPSPTDTATATQVPSEGGALPVTQVATVIRALPPPAPAGIPSPLTVSAKLASPICVTGIVAITVAVRDGDGNPVGGATVTGALEAGPASQLLSFLPTNAAGTTTTSVSLTITRAMTTLAWTVDASAGGLRATSGTSCAVP